MRKIIAFTQVTLDGVMQGPGGPGEDPSNGFTHGGWAMPVVDDALSEVVAASIAGDFDLLLGRRTYDIFAGHWPNHGDDPIAKAFSRATKYVVTRGQGALGWQKAVRISDPVVELGKLKATEGSPLHVWGSGQLLQTLMGADLVDEHRLWVFPLLLGSGKRLFEAGVPPRALKLVSSANTAAGILINTYRPAGSLAHRKAT